jgi:hypothetical protein
MRRFAGVAAIVLLGSMMPWSVAVAGTAEQKEFSAMQGINAQALSAGEMHAIAGELNAYDIAAALTAEAANLAKYPRLQAADLKWAAWYQTNAVAINAAFQKFGLLTPCKSCGK